MNHHLSLNIMARIHVPRQNLLLDAKSQNITGSVLSQTKYWGKY